MPFRVSALIVGTLVAVLGTVAAAVMYFVLYFGIHAWDGTTPDEETVDASLFAVEALVAPLFTFVGAWLAARMAKVRHLQHGASVGVATVAIWLSYGLVDGIEGVWAWSDLPYYLAEIAVGTVGGYVALRGDPVRDAGARR